MTRLRLSEYNVASRSFILREDFLKDERKMSKIEVLSRYRRLRALYLSRLVESASLKRRIVLLEHKCGGKYSKG